MLDIRKEIEFWTGIMRDHGEFQYMNLSPKETEAIYKANYFKQLFGRLHEEAKKLPEELSQMEVVQLMERNMTALVYFISFKRELLTRLMTCRIDFKLPPSFINHMINEAMEYHRVLGMAQGIIPHHTTLENLRLHKIWLPDASGHATALVAELDPVETEYIQIAKEFAEKFDKLFKKAFEMYKIFERTGLKDGALYHYNQEVEEEINKFIEFLGKLKELRRKCSILGVLKPELCDHMMREETYYMYRIQILYK